MYKYKGFTITKKETKNAFGVTVEKEWVAHTDSGWYLTAPTLEKAKWVVDAELLNNE